jgi:hypothetical protein
MTCFFFSSFKTLLTETEDIPHIRVNVPTALSLAGFQVTIIGRFWVTTEAKKPDSELYSEIVIKKKGQPVVRKDGSPRMAEVPNSDLRAIHKRLLDIVSRVFVPSYLHCSVKRRSYITNAAAHVGKGATSMLDLRHYYPSTTFSHIFGTFRNTFVCSEDVAYVLAKLCSYKGHLPTGSCISARLAYYAH